MISFQDIPIQEKSFLSIPLYIYASIILPFLIFFLGQWILRRRDTSKENQRLRVLEKYIYLNLEMLIMDVQKDIKNTEKLVELLKEDKQQNYVSKGSLDIHNENILSINRTDVYNIFINGKKGDDREKINLFDSLLKDVYSIDHSHKEFPKYFNEFVGFMQEYGKNYSKGINDLRTTFEDYIVLNEQQGIKRSKDDFIREYDELLHEWTKSDEGETELGPNKFDMFYVNENILPKFVRLINKYKTDPRSRRLSDAIVESAAAFKSFKNLKSLYKDLFEFILNNYKQSQKNIKESMCKFKEMKDKRIKI